MLLVSVAVLALLFARGERRAFHLPGGDGVVVLLAGAWVAVLVFYRMFDKPGTTRQRAASRRPSASSGASSSRCSPRSGSPTPACACARSHRAGALARRGSHGAVDDAADAPRAAAERR